MHKYVRIVHEQHTGIKRETEIDVKAERCEKERRAKRRKAIDEIGRGREAEIGCDATVDV